MKCAIFIFSLAVLFSCNGENKNEKPAGSNEEQFADTSSKENLHKESGISGNWFSDDLCKKIEQSKSVYDHFESGSYPILFGFSVRDSLAGFYMEGYDNHEGGYATLLKKSSQGNYISDERKEYYLKVNVTSPNVEGLLKVHFDEKNKTEFFRPATGDDAGDTEFRKILFEGKYTDKSTGNKYVFESDGKISGFGDRIYYDVFYDFTEGIFFDAITLYRQPMEGRLWSEAKVYKYKIIGKQLSLQEMGDDKEEMN